MMCCFITLLFSMKVPICFPQGSLQRYCESSAGKPQTAEKKPVGVMPSHPLICPIPAQAGLSIYASPKGATGWYCHLGTWNE